MRCFLAVYTLYRVNILILFLSWLDLEKGKTQDLRLKASPPLPHPTPQEATAAAKVISRPLPKVLLYRHL